MKRLFSAVITATLLVAPLARAGETFRDGTIAVSSTTHPASLLRAVAEETQEAIAAHRAFLADQGVSPAAEKTIQVSLLSSREEYESYKAASPVKSESPRGFYAHSEQRIVTWEAMDGGVSSELHRILVHETLHHELHSALGDNLPLWLDEGLAVLFENAALVSGMRLDAVGSHRAALSQVKLAASRNQLMPLETLLRLDRQAFYNNNATQNYSQAWSFVHFLTNDSTMKNRRVLASLLNAAQKGQNLEDVLTAQSGQSLAALQGAWHRHLARL